MAPFGTDPSTAVGYMRSAATVTTPTRVGAAKTKLPDPGSPWGLRRYRHPGQ